MTEASAVVEAVSESAVAAAVNAEPKLWAGKYKTPEEMETAIQGKDKEYVTLSTEFNNIKNKYTVPESYTLPADLSLREAEAKEIQTIAKNAGLTQEQFERTAREMQSRLQANIAVLENNKKEIGEEKLAILNDYVKKFYPENLQGAVLNQILKDKNAMNDALKDREDRLNSQAPGMDRANQGAPAKYDGQKDLYEAAEAYRKNPNQRTRAKYIDIARQTGDERFKDKM